MLALESWFDQLFASHPLTDEILFDGLDSLCLVQGDQRHYQASPLHTIGLDRVQDFALAQGLRWDPLQPSAGGVFSVEDRHYRWHGVLPPVSRDGLLLSVRRHRLESFELLDFVPPHQAERLLDQLKSSGPVLISGPTGAGKTSFMVTVLLALAASERVAILEQLPELPRLSPRWIRLCAQAPQLSGRGQVSLDHLVDELLRLRPDRIVLGELRREEVSAFKRALLAGHASVWTTVHARSPEELPQRLAEMSGTPPESWRELLVEQKATYVQLERKSPRFRGLWCFEKDGITSWV